MPTTKLDSDETSLFFFQSSTSTFHFVRIPCAVFILLILISLHCVYETLHMNSFTDQSLESSR